MEFIFLYCPFHYNNKTVYIKIPTSLQATIHETSMHQYYPFFTCKCKLNEYCCFHELVLFFVGLGGVGEGKFLLFGFFFFFNGPVEKNMSQLSVMILQERGGEEEEGARNSINLALLLRHHHQMDSVDIDSTRRRRPRMSLKERLGLKGLGCCGATWGLTSTTTISVLDDDEEEHHRDNPNEEPQGMLLLTTGQALSSHPGCLGPGPTQQSSGMNLAAALAAERQFRAVNGSGPTENHVGPASADVTAPATPFRVSLLRLLEETEGGEGHGVTEKETEGGGGSSDSMCCVCMGRKKGAAFIPCGHTFCRMCSRELWLNRGACPLCNRSILEILDIF